MKIFWLKFQTPEAVTQRSSVKEFLLEISQNLQENIITSNLINIGFNLFRLLIFTSGLQLY